MGREEGSEAPGGERRDRGSRRGEEDWAGETPPRGPSLSRFSPLSHPSLSSSLSLTRVSPMSYPLSPPSLTGHAKGRGTLPSPASPAPQPLSSRSPPLSRSWYLSPVSPPPRGKKKRTLIGTTTSAPSRTATKNTPLRMRAPAWGVTAEEMDDPKSVPGC